jgi:putative ABC transport system permease protein
MDLSPARFSDPARITQFYADLLARIAAVPGVASVGAVNRLPITDLQMSVRVRVDGAPPVAPDALPSLELTSISANYIDTMRIPILRGRGFENAEVTGARPVALVTEAAARVLWPDRDALGSLATLTIADEPERAVQVVGIVPNARSHDVFGRTDARIYIPAPLRPERSMAIAVRSEAADPLPLVPAIRAAAAAFEPNEPLFAVLSMEQLLYNDEASGYVLSVILLVIAGVALCLAAAGIYGVVSYLVEQRTREIGVRIALGAKPSSVRGMVVRQGARPVAGGGLLGLPVAVGVAVAMARVFNSVRSDDLSLYLFVLTLIALVALAATYLPARRASRVDPVIALRQE